MEAGASYYAGAARVVVDGVPLRLARKPSAANLSWLKEWERYRSVDNLMYYNRAEKAQRVAKQAREDIAAYAEILEITESRAKALIAQHWIHVRRFPLVDLSLEYDL